MGLALSAYWCYREGFRLDAAIVLVSSIAGVLATLNFGIKLNQLRGTWKMTLTTSQGRVEAMALYGQKGEYTELIKIYPLFGSANHVLIVQDVGTAQIDSDKLLVSRKALHLLHSSIPYEMQQLLMAQLHNNVPAKILKAGNDALVLQIENGSVVNYSRVAAEPEMALLEKFLTAG